VACQNPLKATDEFAPQNSGIPSIVLLIGHLQIDRRHPIILAWRYVRARVYIALRLVVVGIASWAHPLVF
jgi:hypothetical protein